MSWECFLCITRRRISNVFFLYWPCKHSLPTSYLVIHESDGGIPLFSAFFAIHGWQSTSVNGSLSLGSLRRSLLTISFASALT